MMTFYAKSEGKETIREHTDRLLHNLNLLKMLTVTNSC